MAQYHLSPYYYWHEEKHSWYHLPGFESKLSSSICGMNWFNYFNQGGKGGKLEGVIAHNVFLRYPAFLWIPISVELIDPQKNDYVYVMRLDSVVQYLQSGGLPPNIAKLKFSPNLPKPMCLAAICTDPNATSYN